jgi:hypothetical protein
MEALLIIIAHNSGLVVIGVDEHVLGISNSFYLL